MAAEARRYVIRDCSYENSTIWEMRIERASPEDAAELTGIAFEAKRHWGYPEKWIQRWTNLLTIAPDFIRTNPTFIAVIDRETVGFCGLCFKGHEAVLEHLWVRSPWMGRGVGRILFEVVERVARENGATRLKIESEANAEGFYRRMGAKVCGRNPASMDGEERFLPILEKVL